VYSFAIQNVYACLKEAPLESLEDKKIGSNWPDKGNITFDSYESRYRDGLDLVLNKVSFSVNPNEKVSQGILFYCKY